MQIQLSSTARDFPPMDFSLRANFQQQTLLVLQCQYNSHVQLQLHALITVWTLKKSQASTDPQSMKVCYLQGQGHSNKCNCLNCFIFRSADPFATKLSFMIHQHHHIVLTLVGEIRRCRNDRYYYHYCELIVLQLSLSLSLPPPLSLSLSLSLSHTHTHNQHVWVCSRPTNKRKNCCCYH